MLFCLMLVLNVFFRIGWRFFIENKIQKNKITTETFFVDVFRLFAHMLLDLGFGKSCSSHMPFFLLAAASRPSWQEDHPISPQVLFSGPPLLNRWKWEINPTI